MFRSARRRSEKNRIKIVFRLQFHATQASQFNTEGLILSLVPGDVGKPTAKSEKAVVTDGHCRWEIPVYETVKFVQDAKTGKVNQRIYHLIVSTAGSPAGLVGETSIDFADYADAMKTCNVSLPLLNSNSKPKAVLHVSIQRQLEFDDPQREVNECENLGKRSHGQDLKSHLNIDSADESHKRNSLEEGPFSKAARFAELRRRASVQSDSSMSSYGSVSERNTPGEVGNRGDHIQIQQNHHNFVKSLSTPTNTMHAHLAKNLFEEPRVSESEWSGSSDQGISTDDSTNSSNDTIPRDTARNSSDDEIEKLKADFVALTRQADLSELELQSLRKQIGKETKRSQDLLREVTSLKQERDSLKADCENHKVFDKQKGEAKMRNRLQFEGRDPWILLEETREELDYEKDRNFNLRLQLQKTQESNSELILAVQDLEAMLEERSKEEANNTQESRRRSCRSETDEDEDQRALEELVKGDTGAKDTNVLEQQITDLYNEIETYKRNKDELEIQMEQLALDYEILKQENHSISYKLEQSQLQEQLKIQYECSSSLVNVTELENRVESLEAELKKQSEEFNESLCLIKQLETQVETLEEELGKQSQRFEADIEAVTQAKVEQEQRVIKAEEALRKTRWKHASVAGKIQDEFKRLSEQMNSMFVENERMAMKAMTEANELRMKKRQLEEMLANANDELRANRSEYEEKLQELSESLSFKTTQLEKMLEDLDKKSKDLENQKSHEEHVTTNLNQELTRLKDEIEILRNDKNNLMLQAKQAENLRVELEETRKSIVEAEASIKKGNTEKNELESTIVSLRKESESITEELQRVKLIIDEKEEEITFLNSELEAVRTQSTVLKHSLSENESEIVKHKGHVAQVKAELKKKEEEMANLEKKLKESRATVNNLMKAGQRNNNKGSPVAAQGGSKEVSAMKERIRVLVGQIKLKETALEASSSMFIEKERNLKNRIEELETKLDELNYNEPLSGQENEDSAPSNNNDDLRALVDELATMREHKKTMETELKEMQERYSEISLRFAEVEGERQQLVMTVRNLKNAKKT